MLPGMSNEIFGEEGMISQDNFVAGFIDAINGKTKISPVEAREFADTQVEAIKSRALAEKHGESKAENEKFLEENKNKEGVITTESGLQYKVIKEGKGAIPESTDRVKVNYKGTLIDGTEFDSSYSRNEPATFRANQVIKGWTEALTMMPVGSTWELYIPQDLAYGSSDTGKIPPFSTLIFEVELVEIVQ
ncbi:MAG: FKBP-type peptidyl-prolyl cis-trans isomerase [Bacteroides sp.]|nr:FKBP-type peptidyl-prolyl cis-trans isomerase [Bacteroides sp.]